MFLVNFFFSKGLRLILSTPFASIAQASGIEFYFVDFTWSHTVPRNSTATSFAGVIADFIVCFYSPYIHTFWCPAINAFDVQERSFLSSKLKLTFFKS